MQIVNPSAHIMFAQFGVDTLKKIELVGRPLLDEFKGEFAVPMLYDDLHY